MSKKFTSFLVMLAVMMLTLPVSAQVMKQKAVSAVKEMRELPKAEKLDRVEMSRVKGMAAKEAAKAAEAAGVNVVYDWSAQSSNHFAPKQTVAALGQQGNVRGVLKNNRVALSLKDAAFKQADLTSRHAATTDSHGIITAPDAGEHKYYTREGGAYYVSGGYVYPGEQSGTVEIVETTDGTVYIKDIISRYAQNSWVKGTKSGNTITIPAGQPIAYTTQYGGVTFSLNWGDYDDDNGFGDKLPDDIVFTIAGDVISLEGSNEDHFIGAFWDDDDSFAGYGDYETVWTLDEGYEPPSTELVELPAGANVETWFAVGDAYGGSIPANAKVAFVGNEVYVSGIFVDFPNSWIKGTLQGSTVTFLPLQYLGTYGTNNIWTYAANVNESAGTYVELDAITFTYDAGAKTLTMDANQALVVNAATDRMYYLDYISELTLSVDKPEVEVIKAPYTSNLTLQNEFKKYTVIDANNDGKTWSWSSSYGTYYGYSTSNEANDYLILPIELEANKNYSVTVSAASYSATYPEKFEVKVGKAATVAGLNITAIAPTTVASKDKEALDFDGDFTTDDDAGVWYVAIHAISDKNMWNLSVKSLTIELGAEPTAPAAPVLTATAGAEGALEVNVSVTAPTTAINGSNLSGTVDVKIYRDDEVVKSYTRQQPGATLTWKDEEVEDGASYVYYAQASNTKGTGAKSEKVSVWVGQDAPADVENVQVTGMPTGNSISLSWDAVEGLNGGYINPATVKYDITTIEVQEFWGMLFPMEGETIGSVTGQTTATVNFPVDEGEPYYGYFGVKAVVGANESDPTSWFAYALIGAPYELPIEEHFTGSALHYFWDYNENAALGVSQDGSDGDVALALTGYEAGAATFETFKLDVKSAANPTVLFDAKKGTSNTDKLTVYAITPAGETTELETVTLGDAYQTYKVVIPASLKNERWVRIGFMANISADQTNVLLDNIKILDLYQYDLSVAVDAPKSVQAGKAATITATVKNEGENAASGYTVTIKAGDETLLTETASEALAPFTTAEFTAELATTIFDDAADVTITATVTYTNDLNPDNDAAETIISVKESTAAPVTDVVAAAVEDVSSILVSWTAPDLDAVQAEEVTESFEEGTGGWTFIDADGDGFNWEYHYNTHETGTDITAHTGEGTVHSASYDNDTQRALTPDNWLVSPDAVLDGTFKFWAVGQDADYCKEHFQVYVSTESATDVSTFKPVSAEFVATGEYKEYTADLSSYAGAAGWIAIRHFNVTDEFELVVDDITFLAGTGSVEIDHFNIYLDGELVATATADEVTATLEDVADGSHTVAVSVVYTNGQESKPVEATVSVATGLNKITVVTQPVDVYTLDGKLVRKQTTSFDGLKGVYIVGGNKVLLK